MVVCLILVLPVGSLLVFDCGGNTQENKRRIQDLNFHYQTLKAKKKGSYRNEIASTMTGKKVGFHSSLATGSIHASNPGMAKMFGTYFSMRILSATS